MKREEILNLYYFKVTDLWKRLCEEHNELFNLTCDEYSYLLDSNIESLEEKLKDKNVVIENISKLEKLRQETIKDLNSHLPQEIQVKSVSDLLQFMIQFETERNHRFLNNFNALLIDIIQKIQTQNRRNQMFLNKAIKSLKDIREQVTGEKSYQTYSPKGATRSSTIRDE